MLKSLDFSNRNNETSIAIVVDIAILETNIATEQLPSQKKKGTSPNHHF